MLLDSGYITTLTNPDLCKIISKGLFKAMAIKHLSVALVKGNAVMYRACLSACVEGYGRAPMYGDDLPLAEVSDS